MEIHNTPLVSVIIPIHNVEDYLDKCVESVMSQTYTNLEILLVDDGSTDSSGSKCDEYARKDTRIKVIHKVNGGSSDARNAALDVMTGEYLTFVDSDDYIDKRLVERLMGCVLRQSCDLAVGGFIKTIAEVEDERNNKEDIREKVLQQREALLRMLYRKEIPGYSHGKIYRAALFSGIRFPVGKVIGEDTITTYNIINKVNKVGIVDYPMYYYRQRQGSIVHIKYRSSRLDVVHYGLEILNDVKEDTELRKAAEAHLFFALMDNYALVDSEHKADRIFLEEQIKKYRGSVLRNSQEGWPLRIMAFVTFFPGVRCARLLGRFYKRSNQQKWIKEEKRYQC